MLSALALGIDSDFSDVEPTGGDQPDFVVRIGDSVLVGEVKSIVTGAGAEQLLQRARRLDRPSIVVADRIAEDAKQTMRRAGVNYLDRRGYLRLFAGPVKVDAKVPASSARVEEGTLSSQVAKEVAISCLRQRSAGRSRTLLAPRRGACPSWPAATIHPTSMCRPNPRCGEPSPISARLTESAARACTVAVAPVRLVCLHRHDRSQITGELWPVVDHIVVALDIATDKARGLEVLEQWHPEGIVRGW